MRQTRCPRSSRNASSRSNSLVICAACLLMLGVGAKLLLLGTRVPNSHATAAAHIDRRWRSPLCVGCILCAPLHMKHAQSVP